MYSPAVTSGLGFVYKLGQCLAQLIISRVREWRSSRYGGTEKVSAGLLGAAPASGSPSRGMAVGLIWPGCTPHPLPTTGVSLLGLGFGPRQLVSGSLPPVCRDRRASGSFFWAEPRHRVSTGGCAVFGLRTPPRLRCRGSCSSFGPVRSRVRSSTLGGDCCAAAAGGMAPPV